MAVWLPLLIVFLILTTLRKGGHRRKVDLGFVVVILILTLVAWSGNF
jgi:hypothetical protein